MADAVIDPITGEPKVPDLAPVVSKEEFDNLNQRLDAFEQQGAGNQFQTPPAPVTPAGPTYADEIKLIKTQLETYDSAIDLAVADGNPVSALLRQRDELTHKITRLTVQNEDINPAMSAGIETIDQLSSEITRNKMPHYDVVKTEVETSLAGLPANQRMNPQVRLAAYNMAVGQNIVKIMDQQKEEILRTAAEDANLAPGNSNGRNEAALPEGVPKPQDILKKSSLAAIKGQGISVDEYYTRRGHDGWAGFWEKVGKNYFGDPN